MSVPVVWTMSRWKAILGTPMEDGPLRGSGSWVRPVGLSGGPRRLVQPLEQQPPSAETTPLPRRPSRRPGRKFLKAQQTGKFVRDDDDESSTSEEEEEEEEHSPRGANATPGEGGGGEGGEGDESGGGKGGEGDAPVERWVDSSSLTASIASEARQQHRARRGSVLGASMGASPLASGGVGSGPAAETPFGLRLRAADVSGSGSGMVSE